MAEPTISLPKFGAEDVQDPNTEFWNVQEPPEAKKNSGLAKGDGIPRQWFNWLWRSTYEWLSYLRQQGTAITTALANEVNARIAAVSAEALARSNADTTLQNNITTEVNNRTTDVNAARASLLKLGNDVIDGAGLTPYANLAVAETAAWERLIQAILYQQDFPVQFRNSADSVIGTGTITVYTTMSGLKTICLPPINVTDPDVIRIYGAGGAALPGELFPLTPSTPSGSSVRIFEAPIATVQDGTDVISNATFIYASMGAFPTRHIAVSMTGSSGSNNGWRATSITFPSMIPNPIGP